MALYKRPDSPYWWFSIKMPGQPRIFISTKTADKKLAQKIHDVERGQIIEGKISKKPKKILLSRLVSEYLRLNFENLYDLKNNQFTLKSVLSHFKDKFASELSPKDVENYRFHRKQEVKLSTINKEMALLNAAFNSEIKWGDVTVNPLKSIKSYSEKENRRTRHLSQKEKEKLLTGLNRSPLAQKIAVFAMRSGIRRGEVLNLKWTSVDFEKGIITVEQSKGGDKRYLPIHDDVFEILKSLPRDSEYVFSYNKARIKEDSFKTPFSALLSG
jgi:integrase